MAKFNVKKHRIIGLIVASILIVGAVGYVTRGTIRQDTIPSIVEHAHASEVDQVFNAKIVPVLEQLKQHNLIHSYKTKRLTECSTVIYTWLRESVKCERMAYIEALSVDESLKSRWRETIPAFYESSLLKNGWLVEQSETHADAASQLSRLLDGSDRSIAFRNEQTEATCSISFNHRHLEASSGKALVLYAECQRWIKVFGGFPEYLNH